MTYATQQDLVDRFGQQELAQLTDPLAGTVIDAVQVGRALADADAEIDTYLAGRYALPLATTPTVLVRLAADIARYRLWDRNAPELVRERYAAAIKLLTQISSGAATLGTAEQPPAAPGGVAVAVVAPARQFSRELLSRFAPGG